MRPAACPLDLWVSGPASLRLSSLGLHGWFIRGRPALDVRPGLVPVRLVELRVCRASFILVRPAPRPGPPRTAYPGRGPGADLPPPRRCSAAPGERPGVGPQRAATPVWGAAPPPGRGASAADPGRESRPARRHAAVR